MRGALNRMFRCYATAVALALAGSLAWNTPASAAEPAQDENLAPDRIQSTIRVLHRSVGSHLPAGAIKLHTHHPDPTAVVGGESNGTSPPADVPIQYPALSAALAQSYPDVPDGLSDIGAVEEYALYPVTEPGEGRPIRFLFSARGEYQLSTGIDRAGDFSAARTSAGLGFNVPLADRLDIGIGTSFGYTHYDFDRAPVFGGERPWEHIFSGQFTAIANYALDQTWSVFGGGILGLAGEDGASLSDSITGGGMLGGGYRHSDQLVFRLGLSALSQLEDDAAVLPVILMDWKIDDRWRLRLGSLDTGAADLIGGGLNYAISERWSVGGRLSWIRNRFRLDDSGSTPDGVGQEDRFKATLTVNWRASGSLELGLLGGVVFGGSLRIDDENGDRLFDEDYDATAFAGARLVWRF